MSKSRPTDSIFEYPCEFGIKAFGKAESNFKNTVINIIKRHVENNLIDDRAITEKNSKDGNYLSLTVTIQAQSKQQMDAIYQDLSDEPLVLLAL